MTDNDFHVLAGKVAANAILVGIALALATRDYKDPRESLADVLSNLEAEYPDSLKQHERIEGEAAAVIDSYRRTILQVGTIADNYLAMMAAPSR